MSLRRATVHTTIIDNHLRRLHLPQYRPRSRQVALIEIIRLRFIYRRVQNQHRSVDTILVQDQFVRMPDPGYDPFLGRIDKGPNGFRTAGVIGGENGLFAQGWRDVDLELYGILPFRSYWTVDECCESMVQSTWNPCAHTIDVRGCS